MTFSPRISKMARSIRSIGIKLVLVDRRGNEHHTTVKIWIGLLLTSGTLAWSSLAFGNEIHDA